MELLYHIIWIAMWVLKVAVDVCVFFLLVRLALLWREAGWLKRFDSAGTQLVDGITSCAGLLWHRVTPKPLSEQGKLLVSLLPLSLVRLVLSEFARLI